MPNKPVVIAHRGACGYLPEHTLGAKTLAYGFGSDFLEQDVVATRDGVLVVLHDIFLDFVTDVADVYPDRRRADGHWYVIDFDFDELRRIGITERRHPERPEPLFAGRFPLGPPKFPVVSLEEELRVVAGLNHSSGRSVGVYPEIKDPAWHSRHGLDLAHLMLTMLDEFGYRDADHTIFVQCFDAAELIRVRTEFGSRLKLVQLLDDDADLSEAAFARMAEYANGVGMPYASVIAPPETPGGAFRVTGATARAHDAGLLVHPYTFRADRLPPNVSDPIRLARALFEDAQVDGLFCDHPDVAIMARAVSG